MRADAVNVGDVVEYRGETAEVVECWRPGHGVPSGGFSEPVGVVLLLPSGVRVRMVWPLMGDAVTDLEEALVAYPIEAL